MFSVIIPGYNAEKFITRSIDSVLNQTFKQFEIIIVDDGSTDNTLNIVKKYKDSRIKIISQKNSGVSVARNEGIKNSKKQYICFLDADDEWYPNHLEILKTTINRFKNKKFFVTFSNTELLDGTVIKQFRYKGIKQAFYVEDFLKYEFQNNMMKCFNTNCVCVKRDVFEKYGLFEVGEKISEDVDMWNRIMIYEGKVVIPVETVLRHRDYSIATRSMPIGVPFIFKKRIESYLKDNKLNNNMKEELKKLYHIMELASARSYIMHGLKKEGQLHLKLVDKKYVSKKKYYETLISLLLPSWIMKKINKFQGRKFYR